MVLTVDVGQEGYEHKKQLEELIHVAGLCIEVLQQNDEYLADVSPWHLVSPQSTSAQQNSTSLIFKHLFDITSYNVLTGYLHRVPKSGTPSSYR